MGDGTKENPYTRKDVLRRIRKNGGTANGLDLSEKVFEEEIDLSDISLKGITLDFAVFKRTSRESLIKLGWIEARDEEVESEMITGAILQNTDLEGASLQFTHLEKAFLTDANLEKANLVDAHLEMADLSFAHLEGAILDEAYLEGANLSGAHLEGAILTDARFSHDTKLEFVDWGTYILGEERKRDLVFAADTYRRLKMWYTRAGYHDIAAKFYYREKEAGRKRLKLFSKLWYHRLALKASYRFSGYGERWERILIWVVVVILGLAAAYYFWGSFTSSSFWDTLYYSAASFSALGYGNWAPQPTGWAKGMGAAEAIIGVFMMALLLVTFVRKWTR